MLYFKECPRCQGDVKTNKDIYGEYKECLQCGYMLDIEKPSVYLAEALSQSKKKKVA